MTTPRSTDHMVQSSAGDAATGQEVVGLLRDVLKILSQRPDPVAVLAPGPPAGGVQEDRLHLAPRLAGVEGLNQLLVCVRCEVLAGPSWQRCRVHFMRNLLARMPKHAQPMVAALVRTIFAQPDAASTRGQLEHVAGNVDGRFPQAASLLRHAGRTWWLASRFRLSTGGGSTPWSG